MAFLESIVQANSLNIQEAIRMRNALTTEKVLEEAGWIAKWEARGEARGRAEGEEQMALTIAQNMVKSGLPVETIVSYTELDPEKVKAL
jgi:predicted transposase YdaD